MSSAKQANSSKADPRTVHIALGERSYDIHIGRDLLSHIYDYLPFDLKGRRLFVLTDDNVAAPHGETVRTCLESCQPDNVQMLSLPPGEKTKSFAALERVITWLVDHGADRQSVLFAVGGGVIGDLGGFAAAVTMRGIPYVQVPTTLLAQVDSSVGGKTAINIPEGKNLVGAFYQPVSVVCDLDVLKTLPRRELLAGYAETVKYGLIDDPEFFIWLEKEGLQICALEFQALARAVETACRKKAEIVKADEKEQGQRALLNLGHTFGHALEAAAGYEGRLLHGEAVSIGMVLAFRLSCRMGICEAAEADRVEAHLEKIGLPVRISQISPPLQAAAGNLMDYMKHDKKMSMGTLKYIVTGGIGKAHISSEVAPGDVKAVLNHSIKGT